MSCVLLDVDGTLIPKPGTEILFAGYLVRRRVLGLRQVAAALQFLLGQSPAFGRHTPQKNKAYLAGLAREHIRELAEQFVVEVVRPRLRPELSERLDNHRASGHAIALLTGTPDFLAEPIARCVGAGSWEACVCAEHDGRFTTDPPRDHPFGPLKTEYARRLCRTLDVRLDQCIAYADSGHDIPLLASVGMPVAVAPDRRLARRARSSNWEIVHPRRVTGPPPARASTKHQ